MYVKGKTLVSLLWDVLEEKVIVNSHLSLPEVFFLGQGLEGAVSNAPLASSFFHSPTSTAAQPSRQEGGWRGMPLTAASQGLLALVHLQSPRGGWRIS